jgi:hypothetical protein
MPALLSENQDQLSTQEANNTSFCDQTAIVYCHRVFEKNKWTQF